MAIKLKVGDSIRWGISYKQADGITPVNLTGYTIDVDAYNKESGDLLFNVGSDVSTQNTYIDIPDRTLGAFNIIVKDTSAFPVGSYLVDIEYTSADGFKISSKSFELKVVERL